MYEFSLRFEWSLFLMNSIPALGQIWTNDGLIYWRIYAPLGLNELKGECTY